MDFEKKKSDRGVANLQHLFFKAPDSSKKAATVAAITVPALQGNTLVYNPGADRKISIVI